MRKAILIAAACAALASCSKGGSHSKEAAATTTTPGHYKIVHPKLPDDPQERRKAQEAMVESMVANPQIDLGALEGEAYRRGVQLTPDQIARKKAQPAPHRP